jgi:hypothetical protein
MTISFRAIAYEGRSLPPSFTVVKKAHWYRYLCNGYEPDNTIKLTGELVGDCYVVFEMWGSLIFNDGHFFASIHRNDKGEFVWRTDDRTGHTATFADAWDNMPTCITDPDHYEESDIIYSD